MTREDLFHDVPRESEAGLPLTSTGKYPPADT